MANESSKDNYSHGGMPLSTTDANLSIRQSNRDSSVRSVQEKYFSQYIDTVQNRMQNLFEDARQFPAQHSNQLFNTLEELRLAVEELHVAEEELISQNEELAMAKQLAEAESHRYQELFEGAPDGYIVTNKQGVVRQVNRAAAAMLNVQPKYLVGKPLVTSVAEPERRGFCRLLNQIATTSGRVQGWELTLLGRRQAPLVAAVTVEVFNAPASEASTLRWQLRDITDLKQAEASLSQLQAQNLELLEVDRLRTQFLATVSHELKTPMNAILGFSQMLMRQFPSEQDPRTLTMVERIFQNGQHLLSLIEDMLHFSRLRANQVDLKLNTFDLTTLVTATVSELAPLAEQKGLLLETDLPNEALMVLNDCSRVRQILTNLLSNAIKFTDVGRVTVGLRSLSAERLLLQVRDTGCGIAPEDQPNVFKEFWQVHNSRHQSLGTGLGLAIVNALVETMQGNITIESELGRGTQFRIELPVQVDAKDAEAE